MENKDKTELLKLKVDIIEILLEIAVKTNQANVLELITKLQKLIK